MGFLALVPAVEKWLDEAAEEWSQLSDREYGDFWRRWRNAFENRLSTGKPTARDIDAMARIERELPFEAVVFSAPGYDFLPSSTPDRAPVFAYRASRLTRIDRERCTPGIASSPPGTSASPASIRMRSGPWEIRSSSEDHRNETWQPDWPAFFEKLPPSL